MKEITLEKIKKYNDEFNSNKWNKIISNAITTNVLIIPVLIQVF